ncbi:ccobyrinic acid a,c-diamide synthase [Bacillus sp. OxB-1]|uniref:cobyrinate a,c-diamide synthase n=1 Tax=Bacillus sp. (strain OxB-1) TaxID=98228 RepID=UPI000582167C|nr:cobyrinate a,c-diamide synthase [Bacillus sp. OxB-1]BAQ10049.1 ccobyrinic acid a,c-diamide synthase [Bacillus sp. OxB-1]
MNNRRLVIAGTGSGVGKTTITIGLMAALMKKGLTVQGFKCGPDYIDPSYHTAVTKRVSRNLDSWMLGRETVLDIFTHASRDADISIMEGVMGFFDGKDPKTDVGSTAEISVITKSPVLLVVNCASMARSAAAIVKGFQTLSSEPNVVGVIANRVGSEGHFNIVKTAIEQECGIPVIGYLKRENGIEIPERSLGLIPSIERGELDPFFEQLGELVSGTVDLEKLLEISQAEPLSFPKEESLFTGSAAPSVRIAVAKDAAFNSYYMENFELLESHGAELVPFSPLADEPVPADCDGLYIGGSLPEEFVSAVSNSTRTKQSIRDAVANGMPTFAEGGGFSYLTESITKTDGQVGVTAGVIPGNVTMHKSLKAIGYREIKGRDENFLLPANKEAKGHEFHYSTFEANFPLQQAYETKGMRGIKADGVATQNLVAGFPQFHFATCLDVITRWIDACQAYQNTKLEVADGKN